MKIKVVGCVYTVTFGDPALLDQAEVYGFCNKTNKEIFIDAALSPRMKKEIMLHEVMHALWHEHRFPDKQKEEDVVTWLAHALSVFIYDNIGFANKYLP